MKQAVSREYCWLFHAGLWLALLFDPEDGGDIFLPKVGSLSMDYMTLIPEDGTLNTITVSQNTGEFSFDVN
jgi:hypothetical protein